jgi:hypothetical protein
LIISLSTSQRGKTRVFQVELAFDLRGIEWQNFARQLATGPRHFAHLPDFIARHLQAKLTKPHVKQAWLVVVAFLLKLQQDRPKIYW